MNDSQFETLEQVRHFPDGVTIMEITIASKIKRYQWIRAMLVRFPLSNTSQER